MSLQGKYYFHVTDERGSERVSQLPDPTQLANGSQVLNTGLITKPASLHLYCLSHLKYVYIIQKWLLNLWFSDEMIEWSGIKTEFCLYREIQASRKGLKSLFVCFNWPTSIYSIFPHLNMKIQEKLKRPFLSDIVIQSYVNIQIIHLVWDGEEYHFFKPVLLKCTWHELSQVKVIFSVHCIINDWLLKWIAASGKYCLTELNLLIT